MRAKPRQRRDSGDLCQLKVELWAGVRAAAAMVDDPGATPTEKLRAISALATAGAVYLKLLSETEIEARLSALERAAAERHGHGGT